MNTLSRQNVPTDSSLTQQLAALHESYVFAVNEAVSADDLVLADELARDFDRETQQLLTSRAAA